MGNKMAGYIFIGSTKNEQELAKEFWKDSSCMGCGNFDKNLTVKHEAFTDKTNKNSMGEKALKGFWAEVEKRKKKNEDETFQKFENVKKESQFLLNKRREERIKREEISKHILGDKFFISSENDGIEKETSKGTEAIETIKYIDDFENR